MWFLLQASIIFAVVASNIHCVVFFRSCSGSHRRYLFAEFLGRLERPRIGASLGVVYQAAR
jgi:hypothetical protein